MKRFLILNFIIGMFAAFNVEAQNSIRFGLKDKTLNLSDENVNFLDAFEHEVSLSLLDYLEEVVGANVQTIKIAQSDREAEIETGDNIDILLYSFSKTPEREAEGIIFSIPYYQNSAIVLASRKGEITVNDLGVKNLKIGYIRNTTGEEVKTIRDRYESTIELQAYDSYEDLLEGIKNKEVNAIVGDISRMLSDFASGELYLGGNLPTKRSRIRDNYCIAISPNRADLKQVIDDFLRDNELIIAAYKSKWVETSLQEAYSNYYNTIEPEAEKFNIILYSGLVLLAIAFLAFLRVYLNQKKKLDKAIHNADDFAVQRFSQIFRQDLVTDELVEEGAKLFDKAEHDILYVGSAGFLSATEENRIKWSTAIDRFLAKEVVFDRIIDLPKFDFKNRIVVGLPKEHYPSMYVNQATRTTYIKSYVKWLLTQYHNLIYYNSEHSNKYNIYDSRAAALWGSGIVIVLKDSSVDNTVSQSSGVYFTTYGGENVGAKIFSPSLARKWGDSIRKIKSEDKEFENKAIRMRLTEEKMFQVFFADNQTLTECANIIESKTKASKEPIINNKDIQDLIEKAAGEFDNWFNKRIEG